VTTVAPAVIALQHTLDKARPGRRDRYPDGTIGDAAHAARGWPGSDHNPDPDGLATAVDVHDSDQLDDGSLYDSLKAAGALNPVKYAINNGRIWSPERGEHVYTGPSPHPDHCHVSVTQAGKRRTGDWFLPGITTDTEDDMTAAQAAMLAEVHKMLKALVAPRRPDKVDVDPGAISLGDVITAVEKQP
jgi:hypothetical protein